MYDLTRADIKAKIVAAAKQGGGYVSLREIHCLCKRADPFKLYMALSDLRQSFTLVRDNATTFRLTTFQPQPE